MSLLRIGIIRIAIIIIVISKYYRYFKPLTNGYLKSLPNAFLLFRVIIYFIAIIGDSKVFLLIIIFYFLASLVLVTAYYLTLLRYVVIFRIFFLIFLLIKVTNWVLRLSPTNTYLSGLFLFEFN